MDIEVQRLTLRPGDRLVARVDRDEIDAEQARRIIQRIRAALALDWEIPIVIVTREWEFFVEDA